MSAIFSDCELYRWRLERDLGRPGKTIAFIGVNPSTADATINDQTIRKDIGFAGIHGGGRLIKGNLFGFRSTDINGLRHIDDPVGADNDVHLQQIMADADLVIAAWGAKAKLPASLRRRWIEVADLARRGGHRLMCLGTTKDGQPNHTMTLAYETPLVAWSPPHA